MKTISPRFSVLRRSAAGVALLLLATGCSSSKGSVTGKVFYKDKPLPGGMVQFIHPQLGAVVSPIAPDGSYQFEPIPPAEVKICVTGPQTEKGRALPKNLDWEKIKSREGEAGESDEIILQKMGFRPASSPGAVSVSIPKKYADPQQSGLTYTVTSGPQTYDIKLD